MIGWIDSRPSVRPSVRPGIPVLEAEDGGGLSQSWSSPKSVEDAFRASEIRFEAERSSRPPLPFLASPPGRRRAHSAENLFWFSPSWVSGGLLSLSLELVPFALLPLRPIFESRDNGTVPREPSNRRRLLVMTKQDDTLYIRLDRVLRLLKTAHNIQSLVFGSLFTEKSSVHRHFGTTKQQLGNLSGNTALGGAPVVEKGCGFLFFFVLVLLRQFVSSPIAFNQNHTSPF